MKKCDSWNDEMKKGERDFLVNWVNKLFDVPAVLNWKWYRSILSAAEMKKVVAKADSKKIIVMYNFPETDESIDTNHN